MTKKSLAVAIWHYPATVILLLIAIAGCASKRDWRMIPEITDNQYRQQQDNVTVAAECWMRNEDLLTIFKKAPHEDIIALRLMIYNRSQYTVRFSQTQVELILPDGSKLVPLSQSEMTDRLETNETVAGAVVLVMTGGYGSVIAKAITQITAEQNWKRQRDVRKCSMDLATIDPAHAMTGFLFFRCPKYLKKRKTPSPIVTCFIRRMPRVGNSPLNFSIDLPLFDNPLIKENEQ